MIRRGVGQLSRTNHSWVMKVFMKSIAPFFGQNKYTNLRTFSTMFYHKTRTSSLQEVQKIQFWIKWLYSIYLTKDKSGTLSLFIENTQIVQNFGHVQNKSIVYRPDKYNLQARTLAFPVTKNWNWPFLISQQLKPSNINIGHKSKIVWNKGHIFQTRTVQFEDQKKSEKAQIVQTELLINRNTKSSQT